MRSDKRVIEQLIERVWRNGHIDELPDFWTADCINHADPAPEKRSLAAVRLYHESFAQWFRDFDNVDIEVQQQVAESESSSHAYGPASGSQGKAPELLVGHNSD